mmetsp:Transcript_58223/g.161396  ORF Transcript_58223/g.161396 Transcript_58223/m.161396 type:complete len:84 (-) Transcript_58223:1374-1625(-)
MSRATACAVGVFLQYFFDFYADFLDNDPAQPTLILTVLLSKTFGKYSIWSEIRRRKTQYKLRRRRALLKAARKLSRIRWPMIS